MRGILRSTKLFKAGCRIAICAGTCLAASVILTSRASAQSLVEGAAAAAGGTVGGVAGKKVSDGITAIFGKVDKQTGKAAKTGAVTSHPDAHAKDEDSVTPLFEVGPGVVRSDSSNVPPPPPARHAAMHKPAPVQELPAILPPPPVPIPPPPPPTMTADDLKHIGAGMQREEVLRFGLPSSRITMVEDGHLLEVYSYQANDATFGVVRLIDGAVSTVVIH
jgi:hypothetical protein